MISGDSTLPQEQTVAFRPMGTQRSEPAFQASLTLNPSFRPAWKERGNTTTSSPIMK